MGRELEAAAAMPLNGDSAEAAQAVPADAGGQVPAQAVQEPLLDEDVREAQPSNGSGWTTPFALGAAVVWTAFFGWAHRAELTSPATPAQWADWIVAWAVPVLLVVALWLAARRQGARDTSHFGDAAQALAGESRHLEQRLAHVNRELSQARETLAAQARELDGLGRIASETLSQNAERLQHLIRANGEEISATARASTTALENMIRLREDLPAIASSAQNIAGQISQAGDLAREQVVELGNGLGRLAEAGQTNQERIVALREQVGAAMSELAGHADRLAEIGDQRFTLLAEQAATLRGELEDREEAAFAGLHRRAQALRAEIESRREDFEAAERAAGEAASRRLAAFAEEAERIDTTTAERAERHLASMAELSRREEALTERLTTLAADLDRLVHQGRDTQDRLEDTAAALAARLVQSRGMIDEGHEALKNLTSESARLLEMIQMVAQQSAGELPSSLEAAHVRLGALAAEAGALRDTVDVTGQRGAELAASMNSARGDGAAALEHLAVLDDRLNSANARATELAERARGELAEAISGLEQSSFAVLERLREDHSDAVRDMAERLGGEGASALDEALRTRMDECLSKLREASDRAGESGQEAAQHLRERLAEVEALTSTLEQRIAQARARAAEPSEQDFARRMALIAESLNSASVDLSRVFAGQISDADWTAYLRGDRAIFTRRTLRLLDRKEARAVAEIYQENGEFRAAVNRYVHDFEAMLRDMLSTRDGHTLAVTLLSSDVGKLYVALAQATERQRD